MSGLRDEIRDAIREDWHDAGMYGRADFDPRWLDGLSSVTAQAATNAVLAWLAEVLGGDEVREAVAGALCPRHMGDANAEHVATCVRDATAALAAVRALVTETSNEGDE